MKKDKIHTDWDKYYTEKKSRFSTYTQKFTGKKICKCINKAYEKNVFVGKVAELGGGNSCFAKKLSEIYEFKRYDIFDNNKTAIDKFMEKDFLKHLERNAYCIDLATENISSDTQYDFVYSVGLIEHFGDEERKRVIDNHFRICHAGGVVFITFPTPTFKYRFFRKFLELIHRWQFWDETPLTWDDVRESIEDRGSVLMREVNWELFLTQMVVAVRVE